MLRREAPRSKQLRVRFCAHRHSTDLVHEMIIALARDSYIAPHQHKNKSESYHIIEGDVDLVIFDAQGVVTDVVRMGPPGSGKTFYYRMASPLVHMPVVKSDVVIFHEVTNGPFVQAATAFPSWAPPADQPDKVAQFMSDLRKRIK